MNYTSPVRLYPCLHCWTPEIKCREYVFLKRSVCVDCQASHALPRLPAASHNPSAPSALSSRTRFLTSKLPKQTQRREAADDAERAAEAHEQFVRYLLNKYTETNGITYEEVNMHIARSRELLVDNSLTMALDYIYRNFPMIYYEVCDAVEMARARGPRRWSVDELVWRLEQVKRERDEEERARKNGPEA